MMRIRNSLQNKLIILLLFAIIVPISTSLFVTYQYTKASVKNSYIQDNNTLLYQGAKNIANYLTQINHSSLLLYQDPRNHRSMHRTIEKQEIHFVDEQDFFVNMQTMSNSLAEIKQIHIYMSRSNLSYRYAYNLLRNEIGQTYSPTFPENKDYFIEPAHINHMYSINKFPFEQQEEVITFHRKILNLPSDEILGTVSIDIKMNKINEINEMLYEIGNEQLFLIDQNGALVYASDSLEQGRAEQWMHEIVNSNKSFDYVELKEQNFHGIHLYRSVETPFAEWTLVKRIPFDHLYQSARQLTLINSLIVVLFLTIAIIAILYISFQFTTPIKQLIRYINRIELGQMTPELETTRDDEIGILSRRFHQLMQRLHQHINKEYRLELANRTNQLKALQAQVNPHFMNNALQSIGTLALQNNQKKIYALISSLGKMMRYQMNTNETLVPLQMEVDYVRAYLDLQSQRFEEKLQFHFHIDEQVKHIEVPRMILQPIVENCFKHGFVKQNNTGEIWISASIQDQQHLVISVADNGSGMEPSELYMIQKQLLSLHAWHEGNDVRSIGLFNVQSRLKLYYNQYSDIRIEANHPQGLRVTISILLSEGEAETG